MNAWMKSHQRPIILLGLLALGLVTCQKKVSSPEYNSPYDETSSAYVPTPNLNTAPVSNILALSAISGGTFENDYGKPVTAKGVCWSLVVNPVVGGSCTNEGASTTSFSSNLTGLLADTLYYVRAYATNEAGTIYGGQRSFKTLNGRATFEQVQVRGVMAKSAILVVNVTMDGGAPVVRKGFVYSTRPEPTVNDSVLLFTGGADVMEDTLTNLRPSTEYHVRAFVENTMMLTYSASKAFNTSNGIPVISNMEVAGVTSSGATLSARIESDGGDFVVARGFCYSREADPTFLDDCIPVGVGKGDFSTSMTGLERGTAYFVRAYATNSIRTEYGSQLSFVTSSVLPKVNTGLVTEVTSVTATASGEVVSDGGALITARGICYSTTPNPTTDSTCKNAGTGLGAFSASLTGLLSDTIYYFRAFAINAVGTAYGGTVTFRTDLSPVSDVDGNIYQVVKIGSQTWMASNLKTTRYRDGSSIPYVTDNTQWANQNVGARSVYEHNNSNYVKYGNLYNWFAVSDDRGLCPSGWHVPSDAEWGTLSSFLISDVGYKMKSTSGWANSTSGSNENGNGSNESGFTGLPGGYRGLQSDFYHSGLVGLFWSSTGNISQGKASQRELSSNNRKLETYSFDLFVHNIRFGFSVRCLRDLSDP